MHSLSILYAAATVSSIIGVGAHTIDARSKHNCLNCCHYYSGKWNYDPDLTYATCIHRYPLDGEFRNNQCCGVHTELGGTDFFYNCKDIGNAQYSGEGGTKYGPWPRSEIGSAPKQRC
ncbi:hypothetical protein AC579_29 [Pseudocercospora musae]|uniref:Cyanovirin-N domain-containing protein n=1 Tax=Pseudocercospora musae TaxID=113226 RepID=A0A139GWM0_9PEZI|nr:hypothetical protein AC579_29 [Pseudocercospora musae]